MTVASLLFLNGEIYNFLELRRELEGLGHTFQSATDSEVVLAAYVQWGEECQQRFNGMWAFALWDAREKTLFLSRDRFGVKPLYYVFEKGCFAFGSEMKAFLPLSWFPVSIDPQNMAFTFQMKLSLDATEHCLFKNVKRLCAGHCLHIRLNDVPVIRRWWNTLGQRPLVPGTAEEQVEQFRSLFFDACKIRMRSDVALGTTLSGGLDSSSIFCVINEIRKRSPDTSGLAAEWQKSVTACFPGCLNDEREYAQVIVDHTQTQANFRNIDPLDVISTFDHVLFSAEEVNDHLNTYWLIYRELRRAGVVVCLDGHGGDELLGGYPWHTQTARMDAMVWPIDTTAK